MHRSLLLLSRMRLFAQARRLRRTLSTPRGLLMALVATVFFGMTLLPYVVTRGMATPVPEDRMPLMTWFLHPAALFAYWLFSIAGGHFKSPIAFSMPEVEFFFPGPFTRRELLVYKLAASSIGTLGFAIFMPLVLPMVWGPAGLVGIWLTLTFMHWSSVLMALVASWLGTRYRLALVTAIFALVAAIVLSAWQSGALDEAAEPIARLRALESSLAARVLLAPFEVFSHTISARSLSEHAPWAAGSLVLTLVVGGCVLVLDRHFMEASLDASRQRFEALQRFKRTGGMPTIGRRNKPRLRLAQFPRLAGAGPIAWRQALEMLRGSGRLIFAAAAIVGPVAAMVTAAGQREGAPPAGIIVALTVVIGFMISAIMPLGLRTDLDHVDVIKSLPISSQAIVWGSIGASIVYILLVQCVALVAIAWVLGGWSLAMSGALALAVPLNLLTVATDSSLVLLFPSIRHFSPGDVLLGVRMVLVNFVKVILAALAATVAGLALLAGRLLLPEVPLAGLAAAWVVLVLEGLAVMAVAGLLFRRYDVSEHALEGE